MLYQLQGWASDENYLTDENFPIYGIIIIIIIIIVKHTT